MKYYHTREGYESLYLRLVNERNMKPAANIGWLSDYQLLQAIDRQLIELGAIPLEPHEFELELH